MNTLLRTLLAAVSIFVFSHFTMHDGDDDLVKTKSFTVAKGGTLELSVSDGDVRIVPWEKGEVFIKVRGADQEDLDGLSWSMTGNTVRVRSQDRNNWGWSSHLRYEISVPSTFDLDLETSAGQIDIQGPLTGSVKASSSAGDVLLGSVTGTVDLHTSGGDVRAGTIDGDLIMKTSGGDIEAGKVSGIAELSTSGGNIRIEGVKKNLHAKTSGGDITVGDVGGEVSVSTSGGNIDIGKVGGPVTANTAGGDVDLGAATGAVSVKTSGGDLRLLNLRGTLEAKTAGGDVVAELTPDGKGRSRLSSAGGAITLYLPENAHATVDARIRVQGGWRRNRDEYRIRSDFKGDNTSTNEDDRTITGTYTINGGGESISLETVNADIQIRKMNGESHKKE